MGCSKKTPRTSDCVDFKRQAQARLYEATREMSTQQRREHIRREIQTGPLAGFWNKVLQRSKTAPKAGCL